MLSKIILPPLYLSLSSEAHTHVRDGLMCGWNDKNRAKQLLKYFEFDVLSYVVFKAKKTVGELDRVHGGKDTHPSAHGNDISFSPRMNK